MGQPPPRPPNFQRSLARTVTLTDGRKLKWLHDARTALLDVFGSAQSGALDASGRSELGVGILNRATAHIAADFHSDVAIALHRQVAT